MLSEAQECLASMRQTQADAQECLKAMQQMRDEAAECLKAARQSLEGCQIERPQATPTTPTTPTKISQPAKRPWEVVHLPNAYQLWVTSFKLEQKEEYEEITRGMSVSQLAKVLGAKWQLMPDEEKLRFKEDVAHRSAAHRDAKRASKQAAIQSHIRES